VMVSIERKVRPRKQWLTTPPRSRLRFNHCNQHPQHQARQEEDADEKISNNKSESKQ
jgi:hypothetical protein